MFSELVLIFFHDEGFKDVAFLEVPELFERNTAFVAFGNFLYVILEPLQAGHPGSPWISPQGHRSAHPVQPQQPNRHCRKKRAGLKTG